MWRRRRRRSWVSLWLTQLKFNTTIIEPMAFIIQSASIYLTLISHQSKYCNERCSQKIVSGEMGFTPSCKKFQSQWDNLTHKQKWSPTQALILCFKQGFPLLESIVNWLRLLSLPAYSPGNSLQPMQLFIFRFWPLPRLWVFNCNSFTKLYPATNPILVGWWLLS